MILGGDHLLIEYTEARARLRDKSGGRSRAPAFSVRQMSGSSCMSRSQSFYSTARIPQPAEEKQASRMLRLRRCPHDALDIARSCR